MVGRWNVLLKWPLFRRCVNSQGVYLKWSTRKNGAMFLGNWRGGWMNCVCVLIPCRCEMTEGHTLQKPRKPSNTKEAIKKPISKDAIPRTPTLISSNSKISFSTAQFLSIFVGRPRASQDKNMDELGELLKLLGEFPLVFRRGDSRSIIQISILPGSGMV